MSGYTRKKQPDLVRKALLEAASRLAIEQGLSAVTVQSVANMTGVTKGGLFHHFPSKKALLEGMLTELLEKLDAEIDAHMAKDPERFGRFTRAYVEMAFDETSVGAQHPWPALSVTALADPELSKLWSTWISRRLQLHRDTDEAPELEVVRLAADGAWLAGIHAEEPIIADRRQLKSRLLALTRRANLP